VYDVRAGESTSGNVGQNQSTGTTSQIIDYNKTARRLRHALQQGDRLLAVKMMQ
jgi:hypothetical protein